MTSLNQSKIMKTLAAVEVPIELPVEKLSHLCNPNDLPLATTDELPDLQDVIGQPRLFAPWILGLGSTD